uniref:Uncharacterized protein n=1 Tax=Aureoumbra lagunensis TaxID=44058 RepID=A0A7S3NI16_9STRA
MMHYSLHKQKNALGSTPAMLSTRSLPSNKLPAEACPAWCLVNGLFDERQKVRNFNADNIPRLDEQAIIIALRDASRTMRSSLAQWTMKQAAEMYALDIALFGLVYSSNAPLAGVAIAVEPILRASHTIYLKKEQSHRILAFYHILLDLDFFPSSYSYLGGSHSRPRRTAKRQWKAHLPPPTTEHLLFSR